MSFARPSMCSASSAFAAGTSSSAESGMSHLNATEASTTRSISDAPGLGLVVPRQSRWRCGAQPCVTIWKMRGGSRGHRWGDAHVAPQRERLGGETSCASLPLCSPQRRWSGDRSRAAKQELLASSIVYPLDIRVATSSLTAPAATCPSSALPDHDALARPRRAGPYRSGRSKIRERDFEGRQLDSEIERRERKRDIDFGDLLDQKRHVP